MTDEKKPADLDAGGAEAGSQAPDELRRKVAKAALASPVLLTLAPRGIFAVTLENCSPNTLTSLNVAGGSYQCTAAIDNNKATLTIDRRSVTGYQCEINNIKDNPVPSNCEVISTRSTPSE